MNRFLIISFLLLFPFLGKSAHIVGGEIYYDYLGSNQYRIYVSVYRDCLSGGAEFDDPLSLGIFDQNSNLYQNVLIPYTGKTFVPVVFNNPCVTPPNNICTENSIYTTIVTLPPTTGGYTLAYQRCCRTPSIINMVNAADNGFTLTATIPGTANNNYINSSPRFSDYPPQLLCNNEDLVFDHSATDPDGDVLQYSLIAPHIGGSTFNVAPNPPPAPPYGTVNWIGGFSPTNPLGPGASISIDPNTGLLTASPQLTGSFVVGIKVDELRGGVVINSTKRDFLFRVFNCQIELEAILPATNADLPTFVDYCQGLNVQFANNSYGGTNYLWNFGDPTTTSDVSSAFAPSYTYPAPGQYQVQLIVNPGWSCTDTAYMEVTVNNPIQVNWSAQDSLCILDNSFDFTASTNAPSGTQFSWNFGTATPSSATGQTVNNVVFSQSGDVPVTVQAENNLCIAEYTNTVYIFPEPTAEIILPPNYKCEGLDVQFQSNTSNATDFLWNFGVGGNQSMVSDPSFSYPSAGTYVVSLTASSSPSCLATVSETIILKEKIEVDFVPSADSMCLTGNSFDFDGTVSGPTGTFYQYTFGGNANIPSSTDIDIFGVEFQTTGTIPITLTGTHEECVETQTKHIYIITPPKINFGIQPGLQCVPFTAHFVDSSWAETSIFYEWDFGDGGTSIEQNPTHTYTNVGNYNVRLTIRTESGCVDTLTLLKQDMVNVRPNPVANFTVDKEITDICHSDIQFTDLSEGANHWYYHFDENTAYFYAQNPIYQYTESGYHYPIQIVTNEWGCKDTARLKIYIEPYTVFAPNAFTPDGNEFNNVFQVITYLPPSEWEFTIYDRWGQLVYQNNTPNDFWDGTLPNGQKAQDGVYTWVLRYEDCGVNYKPKKISGHITLLR